MGARGPKPGYKKARQAAEEGAATPLSFIAPAVPAELSSADRENPEKLGGDALRRLAHRRGLALSALAAMDDVKIRRELNYITRRQYEEETA